MTANTANGGRRELLTAEEVAEIIGMSRDFVYEQSRLWARGRGGIPTITLGRRRRYRREAIEKWLQQQEEERR